MMNFMDIGAMSIIFLIAETLNIFGLLNLLPAFY